MAGFQRLPHHRDVAGTVEGIIGASDLVGARFCHVDEMRHQVLAEILRIDKVGHPQTLAPRLAVVVNIDSDDHVGAGEPQLFIMLRPIPPSPETIALAPCSTLAVLMTAPTPVVTPQ